MAFRHGLSVALKAVGPKHYDVAFGESDLASLHLARKDYTEAVAASRRAIAVLEEVLGPEHRDLTYPLVALGEAYIGQGNAKKARAPLERALKLRALTEGIPTELHEAKFMLAKALWVTGEKRRAARLAREAHEGYATIESAKEELAEVDSWLAKKAAR